MNDESTLDEIKTTLVNYEESKRTSSSENAEHVLKVNSLSKSQLRKLKQKEKKRLRKDNE